MCDPFPPWPFTGVICHIKKSSLLLEVTEVFVSQPQGEKEGGVFCRWEIKKSKNKVVVCIKSQHISRGSFKKILFLTLLQGCEGPSE